MKAPTNPPQSPSPVPNTPPANGANDEPRGDEFDMSTLPASDSAGPGKTPAPRWTRAWMILAGALVAYCFYFWIYGLGVHAQKPLPLEPIPSKTVSATTVSVYVAGAVLRPGVYALNTDARVSDALTVAGGVTADGDPSSLNLAAFVEDGSKILVPLRAAAPPAVPAVAPTVAVNTANVNVAPPVSAFPNSAPLPLPNSTFDPATANSGTGQTSSHGATKASNEAFLRANPIDLNAATSEQLQQLPGVGPGMAQQILAYRTLNGRFNSVADLDNVKGIGEKRMVTLKDLVVVR